MGRVQDAFTACPAGARRHHEAHPQEGHRRQRGGLRSGLSLFQPPAVLPARGRGCPCAWEAVPVVYTPHSKHTATHTHTISRERAVLEAKRPRHAPTELPEGWRARVDPASSYPYFENEATGQTQWADPRDVDYRQWKKRNVAPLSPSEETDALAKLNGALARLPALLRGAAIGAAAVNAAAVYVTIASLRRRTRRRRSPLAAALPCPAQPSHKQTNTHIQTHTHTTPCPRALPPHALRLTPRNPRTPRAPRPHAPHLAPHASLPTLSGISPPCCSPTPPPPA